MNASAPPRTDWWRIIGITLAVIVTVFGLAVLALAILFFVAMSQWGSNK